MAKEIKFNVKLNVDGKEQLVTATASAEELRANLKATQDQATQLRNSLISFNQGVEAIENVTDAISQISDTISSLTEESRRFADAMAAANTMAGKSGEDFEKLTGQVSELAKTVPMARDALAKGLYQVVSNGVPEDNWLSFLEASAKASVGGIADLEEVVKVTSTVIKNYGLSWEDAESIQDKIQLTAKNGVTSFEQLAQALPRVTANAATLGVSVNDLMAVFATLTGVSGNTAEVSTQLAAVFTALIKPSSEATKMAEAMGIQFDAAAIKAAGGFQTFLKELDQSVKEYSSKSGMLEQTIYGKLFGSAESLRALVPLTGKLSEKFDANAQDMENSADTIKGAFGEMAKTVEAKFQMLKNQFAGVGDILNGLTEGIQPVLNFTSQVGMAAISVIALRRAMVGLSLGTRLASAATAAFGPIMQVARAAMTGATVSATVLTAAIKRFWIATGVGVAIWALTEAIAHFATASDEAAGEAGELGDEMSGMASTVDDAYNNTLKETYGNLMSQYEQLKKAWKSLSTEQQKLDWIKQNQSAFETLRLKIGDIGDAENAFVKNTDKVVEAFKRRAKAAAYSAEITELYKQEIALEDRVKAGDEAFLSAQKQYWSKNPNGGSLLEDVAAHEASVKAANAADKRAGGNGDYSNTKKAYNAARDKRLALEKKMAADVGAAADEWITPTATIPTATASGGSGSHTDKTDKEKPALEGSIDWYEQKLQALRKQITATSDKTVARSLQADYDKAEKQLDDLKKEIGMTKADPVEVTVKTHLEELQAQLEDAQKEFDNATTIEAKVKANAKVSEIQQQIDNATNGKVTISADTEPSYIVQGSAADKRQSYLNAESRAGRIKHDYEIGLIGADEAKRQLQGIDDELTEMGLKPIKLDIDTVGFKKAMDDVSKGWSGIKGIGSGIQGISDALDENKNAWQQVSGIMDGFLSIASGIQAIVELFGALTAVTKAHTVASTADATATTVDTVASAANTAAKSGEAVANASASGAKLPFPANIAAIAAGVAAVVAALAMISGFATGGVVGGTSTTGDRKFVRVNSGEMILNRQQQARLFGLIEGRFNPPVFYDRTFQHVAPPNLASAVEPTGTEVNIQLNANASRMLDMLYEKRRVVAKSGRNYKG